MRDLAGDLFDKAEGEFLKELFKRWNDEQCSHEVTLVFFWRIFYSKETLRMFAHVMISLATPFLTTPL